MSLVLVSVVPLLAVRARADILGAAATYAVLATTQVTNPATNLADTVITGNMSDTSCTGFALGTGCTLGFGTVSGTINSGTLLLHRRTTTRHGTYATCTVRPNQRPWTHRVHRRRSLTSWNFANFRQHVGSYPGVEVSNGQSVMLHDVQLPRQTFNQI